MKDVGKIDNQTKCHSSGNVVINITHTLSYNVFMAKSMRQLPQKELNKSSTAGCLKAWWSQHSLMLTHVHLEPFQKDKVLKDQ